MTTEENLKQIELSARQAKEIIDGVGCRTNAVSTAEGCGDASRFLAETMESLAALRERIATLTAERDEAIDALAHAHQTLASALKARRAEVDGLHAQVATLEAAAKESQKAADRCDKQASDYHARMQDALAAAKERDARVERLCRAIAEYRFWFDTCTKTNAPRWLEYAALASEELDAALSPASTPTAEQSFNDYETEPIGDGNPYYRCVSCKRSDPEINGRLEKHLPDCEYRKAKEPQ